MLSMSAGSCSNATREVGQRPERHHGDGFFALRDEVGQQLDSVGLVIACFDAREIDTGQGIGGVAPLARPFVAVADGFFGPTRNRDVGRTGEFEQRDRVRDRRVAARLSGAGECHAEEVDARVLRQVHERADVGHGRAVVDDDAELIGRGGFGHGRLGRRAGIGGVVVVRLPAPGQERLADDEGCEKDPGFHSISPFGSGGLTATDAARPAAGDSWLFMS